MGQFGRPHRAAEEGPGGHSPSPGAGRRELCPTALDERQRKSLVPPQGHCHPPLILPPLRELCPKALGYGGCSEPPFFGRAIADPTSSLCRAGMLGAAAGPRSAAGPPWPLAPVQRACARPAELPTAGGKQLSQHIATNSWQSGPLRSRRGPGRGKLPWKEGGLKALRLQRRIPTGPPPPRTATCSGMLRDTPGFGADGDAAITATTGFPRQPQLSLGEGGPSEEGSALPGNCFVN